MERLTNNLERDYNDYEHLEIIKKLTKLEDLEEQVGCPLEVRCQLFNNMIVYNDNGEIFIVNTIYPKSFVAELEYDFKEIEFKYSDYEKTWWLKPDRSE